MSTRGRSEPPAAGRWIRDQRERRGIATQAELARRLGWDKAAVNNYETRGVQVPDERAEELATFFGVDIITVRRHLGLWVPPTMDETEKLLTENERMARALREARLLDERDQQVVEDLISSLRKTQNPDREGDVAR